MLIKLNRFLKTKTNFSKMEIRKEYFNVMALKEHLGLYYTGKNSKSRLSFLNFLKEEYEDLCNHYTDDDVEVFLKQHDMYVDFYQEMDFAYSNYDNSVVKNSRFSYFLGVVSKSLLTFVIKEINKIENLNKLTENDINNQINDSEMRIGDTIKMKWQKDNVLIPYLFELLFNEGFILQSDYEDRHKFIEQSFLKKSGKPFTAKESDQMELNYKSNSKSNKKPRNGFKAERVVEKLKSKEKK